MTKKREERFDRRGPIRLMAIADRYCMVRRPGAKPWVLPLLDWNSLAETLEEAQALNISATLWGVCVGTASAKHQVEA